MSARTHGEQSLPLGIEFEKRADGDTIMRMVRGDGSSTWQRHAGARGTFFAYHDLTHLAVERTLALRDGFFGLIARGWDVEDTEGKGSRGALPPGTVTIENLVGLFDRERGGGVEWTAADFNEAARDYAAMHGHVAPSALTDAEIARVRESVRELHDAWRSTPAGGTLRVDFSVSSPESSRGR